MINSGSVAVFRGLTVDILVAFQPSQNFLRGLFGFHVIRKAAMRTLAA
jgi:hypothetical protein